VLLLLLLLLLRLRLRLRLLRRLLSWGIQADMLFFHTIFKLLLLLLLLLGNLYLVARLTSTHPKPNPLSSPLCPPLPPLHPLRATRPPLLILSFCPLTSYPPFAHGRNTMAALFLPLNISLYSFLGLHLHFLYPPPFFLTPPNITRTVATRMPPCPPSPSLFSTLHCFAFMHGRQPEVGWRSRGRHA